MDGVAAPGAPLPGALRLPDGSWVRGRGLRRAAPGGRAPGSSKAPGGLHHPAPSSEAPAGEAPGLRRAAPGHADPTLGLYLGVDFCPAWPHSHLAWPDFRLPTDPRRTAQLLRAAHQHALHGGRVEIACSGGRGRTGTAIAALATLAGVHPDDAVRWTRQHYDRHAVETPWQRRWVRRFPDLLRTLPAAPLHPEC